MKKIIAGFICWFCINSPAALAALTEEIYRFERLWPVLPQPWDFKNPADVAPDQHGYVYVADRLNRQVKRFTSGTKRGRYPFLTSGGRVAFEIAYQLAQQGEGIAFLGILDTNAPEPAQIQTEAENTDCHRLHDLISVFEAHSELDLNLSLAELQATDVANAYTLTLDCFKQHQIVFAPNATVDELKNWVKTFQIAISEGTNYQNAGKVPCPIHLFRATEQQAVEPETEQNHADNRPLWGWSDCTQTEAVEIAVPGDHVTMMVTPQVQILADAIKPLLLIK